MRLGVRRALLFAIACASFVPLITSTQPSGAAQLIAATKAHIASFADVGVALRAGYRPEPTAGPIVHYINAAYVADGHVLDPRQPESLVYEQRGGSMRLVAAMFMLQRSGQQVPAVPAIPYGWHRHVSCWGDGGLGVPVPGGGCPTGTHAERTVEMLHVWLVNVPGGPFAPDMAPQFHCVLQGGRTRLSV